MRLKPHKNITLKRLVLDLYQFFRSQSLAVKVMGRQFQRSRRFVEIDITYKCNLKCINCNRSCTQAPSRAEMPVQTIEHFIRQSIEKNCPWERIRILGGEPTLHCQFFDIIELLRDYRKCHNPSVRLVVCTNLYGRRVRAAIRKLSRDVVVKSTVKTSAVNRFRPFNVAPVDTVYNRFSDYSCGCRIIEDCGLGLTPGGYYICAVAGGIDRIFGFGLGRQALPAGDDEMIDQMQQLCGLCGHFGFARPVRTEKISDSWRRAYADYRSECRELTSGERGLI